MLRVPVIASVGHHADRTLIDDVAAVSCSTPTTPPRPPCRWTARAARAQLHGLAARLERQGRRAIVERARTLARLSRAPATTSRATARACTSTARAAGSARRGAAAERVSLRRRSCSSARRRAAIAVRRGATRARTPPRERSQAGARAAGETLERLACARRPRPQRTLERGYALVEDASGRAGHDGRGRARAAPPHAADGRRARWRSGRRTGESADPSGAPQPYVAHDRDHADLRDRLRADRGDHPPPGLRRGRPARDARAVPGGPPAGRVLRRRARGRRPRAGGSSTSSSPGSSGRAPPASARRAPRARRAGALSRSRRR